jgi:rare lipoprotein A
MVDGKRYDPLLSHKGFVQEGMASWYGDEAHGGPTSCGEIYDMHAFTAAHKTLPMGVYVMVRNLRNGKETVVRINDRGPFVKERIIDLSHAAALQLGITGAGSAPVHIEALGYRYASGAAATYGSPASYDVGAFTVQVAAFSKQGNAERLAARVRKRYGAATIQNGMLKGIRIFRVRIGNYGSLKQAEEARKNFESGGFQGCFIVALD